MLNNHPLFVINSLTNDSSTVGTSSTSILIGSASRRFLWIQNTGGFNVTVSLSDTAVLNEGIVLYTGSSTGSPASVLLVGPSIYNGAVSAISSGGTGQLSLVYG